MLRVLGFSHMHTLGDFGQLHPSLLQGCLKEKTLENLEKYVVKDVSHTDPCGPSLLWSSQSIPCAPRPVLPPIDLLLTSPVCHCC